MRWFHVNAGQPIGLALLGSCLLTTCLPGCGSASAPPTATGDANAPEDSAAADAAMGDHVDGDDEQVAVELAKLPDGEREAAIAQKDCPVSEHALGSMGAPVKVTVEGRDVFICCEGCRDMLTKEPAKYLAKLAPVEK